MSISLEVEGTHHCAHFLWAIGLTVPRMFIRINFRHTDVNKVKCLICASTPCDGTVKVTSYKHIKIETNSFFQVTTKPCKLKKCQSIKLVVWLCGCCWQEGHYYLIFCSCVAPVKAHKHVATITWITAAEVCKHNDQIKPTHSGLSDFICH